MNYYNVRYISVVFKLANSFCYHKFIIIWMLCKFVMAKSDNCDVNDISCAYKYEHSRISHRSGCVVCLAFNTHTSSHFFYVWSECPGPNPPLVTKNISRYNLFICTIASLPISKHFYFVNLWVRRPNHRYWRYIMLMNILFFSGSLFSRDNFVQRFWCSFTLLWLTP